MVQSKAHHLRSLLFRKKKHPVPEDLWILVAAKPGEQQYVEAVVFDVSVLRQIKAVLDLRETWLRMKDLPLDCQMRDQPRKHFMAKYFTR